MAFSETEEFRELLELLNNRDYEGARTFCDGIGQTPLGLYLASEALLRTNNLPMALQWAERSRAGAPDNVSAVAQVAKCQYYNNDPATARVTADQARALDPQNVHDLDTLANIYSRCGQQDDALALFEAAAELEPDNPDVVYNLATSYRFLGREQQAEDAFNRVIGLKPTDYEAVLGRSLLRTQTPESNHTEQLETHLTSSSMNNECRVHYCYSLAKEYEDLARYDDAFRMMKAGADLKHQSMGYLVDTDLNTFNHLQRIFTAQSMQDLRSDADSDRPIFIVGLPWSGASLVERILCRHPDVATAGEIMTLPNIIVPMVAPPGAPAPDPLSVDFSAIGRTYLARTDTYLSGGNAGKRRLIDRLPLNYLNIGYISAALPNARIIRVDRDPVEQCFALYKNLFSGTLYPFTYNLEQLGRYYLGYQSLMTHFSQVLDTPPVVVSREDLLADPEPAVRQLLDACNLAWDDNCLEFQTSQSAVTENEAGPGLESGGGQLWQHYQEALQPLLKTLEAAPNP